MEKWIFMKNCLIYFKIRKKSDDFDEKFVTGESICGHFYPGGLGWGGIWGRCFEKNVGLGGIFWAGLHAEIEVGLGNCVFLRSFWKSARTKMTLTDFRCTFRSIFDFFPNCRAIAKKMGAVWDFYESSLYIGSCPPIFPRGVALFSTWPYFQLPITRHCRPLIESGLQSSGIRRQSSGNRDRQMTEVRWQQNPKQDQERPVCLKAWCHVFWLRQW